jgi:hypothetical protein
VNKARTFSFEQENVCIPDMPGCSFGDDSTAFDYDGSVAAKM